MKRLYFIYLILFSNVVIAQNLQEVTHKFSIGIVPQYAIVHGSRLDFDFRLNEKGHWLVASPQFYINNKSNESWNYNYNYNNMVGAGMDIQHRYYLRKNSPSLEPYFSYGPVFQYFSIKEDDFMPKPFDEGGSSYFELAEQEVDTHIYKYGGNLNLGIQVMMLEKIFLDVYVGTGFRLSYNNHEDGLSTRYNNWWGAMGYSGSILNMGFRIGIAL